MEHEGICPNCESHQGAVGAPCRESGCARKRYHFIPLRWFEFSKEMARRKRKTLDPMLGRYIGRYLLVGTLGSGGMGSVFVALQKPLTHLLQFDRVEGAIGLI